MTALLALASTTRTLWLVVLVLGVVVLAVVVALLLRLYRVVQRIDVGVRAVWESATRLAAHTATTWQLEQTADVLDDLTEELEAHGSALERPG